MPTSNQHYKTTDCIVAFIDVLGSSDMIMKNAQESLEIVHSAYSESVDLFKKLFGNNRKIPSVKIFSDNINVAVPQKKGSEQAAFTAVAIMSAIIQVQFLKHSLLTRGAICSGSYFADDMMVWGTALVNAYKLENSIAIYPRVIIDPELVGKLGLTHPDSSLRVKEWVLQDEDRLFMVNCFHKALKERELFIVSLFDLVDEKITENHDNIKVCQKWLWFSNCLQKRLTALSEEQKGESNENNER